MNYETTSTTARAEGAHSPLKKGGNILEKGRRTPKT